MSEKGFDSDGDLASHQEDEEDEPDSPAQPELQRSVTIASIHEKGTEARRRSAQAAASTTRINSRKSHIQNVDFLKELRMVTEWGAVLSGRGREAVQLQAAQIGGICKMLGGLHSEVNAMYRNFRDSSEELVAASNAAAEHREALESKISEHADRNASLESELDLLRKDVYGELRSLGAECKDSRQSALETVKKYSQAALQEMQQDFRAHIDNLDAGGLKHRAEIESLADKVVELESNVSENFNRLRDERHRVDNLKDHALTASGALADVRKQLEWAQKAERDVKAFTQSIGGLRSKDLQMLRAISGDSEEDDDDGLGEYWQDEDEDEGQDIFQVEKTWHQTLSSRDEAASTEAPSSPSPVHTTQDSVPASPSPDLEMTPSQSSTRASPSPRRQTVQGLQGTSMGDGAGANTAKVKPRMSVAFPSQMSDGAGPSMGDGAGANAAKVKSRMSVAFPRQMGEGAHGVHFQLPGRGPDSSSAISALEKRLAQLEAGEKELLMAHEGLEKRVSAFQFSKGALDGVKKDFAELKNSANEFRHYVTDTIQEVKKQELTHAIQNFRSRWTAVVRLVSPLELFCSWRQFVNMNNNYRRALSKVKSMYARGHVGARVESWNYNSQKCLARSAVTKLESREDNVEQQLETLAAIVRKRERAAVEQAKDVHSRISTVEKRLEYHGSKKADHAAMLDMFAALDGRIENEINPEGTKQNMEELWEAVRGLESTKTDVKMTERTGKRVTELTMEVRSALKDHDALLRLCSTKEDLSMKANASVVEQVLVMLAQQADQLARLVASDLDMFKLTLGRFLELSPDVRKAALSLGLQQNEQCVTCRKMERKLINQPVHGIDGVLYRMSPETLEAMGEETQRVLNEKIKFPSNLRSSVVAGSATSPFGDSWAPVKPQAAQQLKISAKVYNPEEVGKAEHATLLSRIRQLVTREPGWLAGPDLRTLAGSDAACHHASKRPAVADHLPERPISRGSFSARSSPSPEDGGGCVVTSARGRPASGGRNYFPASARQELQGERTLFKDLPQMKSKTSPPQQSTAAAEVESVGSF